MTHTIDTAVLLVMIAASTVCLVVAAARSASEERHHRIPAVAGAAIGLLAGLLAGADLVGWVWGILGGAAWCAVTAQIVATSRGCPLGLRGVAMAVAADGAARWRAVTGWVVGSLLAGIFFGSTPAAIIAGGIAAGWAGGRALGRRTKGVQTTTVDW